MLSIGWGLLLNAAESTNVCHSLPDRDNCYGDVGKDLFRAPDKKTAILRGRTRRKKTRRNQYRKTTFFASSSNFWQWRRSLQFLQISSLKREKGGTVSSFLNLKYSRKETGEMMAGPATTVPRRNCKFGKGSFLHLVSQHQNTITRQCFRVVTSAIKLSTLNGLRCPYQQECRYVFLWPHRVWLLLLYDGRERGLGGQATYFDIVVAYQLLGGNQLWMRDSNASE